MIISLDTETTGTDLRHGAKAYLVTAATEAGDILYWEWDVDPLTREPDVREPDVAEICDLLGSADEVVLQNPKFDYAALRATDTRLVSRWDWSKVRDTLIAGHLLASNLPHDLTAMAVQYVGVDIEGYERKAKEVVESCRRHCRSRLKDWRIAKAGLPEMPSTKGQAWKSDMWLPRALVKHLWEMSPAFEAWTAREGAFLRHGRYVPGARPVVLDTFAPEGEEGWELRPPEMGGSDERWAVTADYANKDSEITLLIWYSQSRRIKQRKLWANYTHRLGLLPVSAEMEARGVTFSAGRAKDLIDQCEAKSLEEGLTCVEIAASSGHKLKLPASGVNASLRGYVFGNRDFYNRYGGDTRYERKSVLRTERSGEPALNEKAINFYSAVIPSRNKDAAFLRHLLAKRKADKAVEYLEGYLRYALPLRRGRGQAVGEDWHVLYPNLNPCGTHTLRWSHKNPNSANISKKEGSNLRWCFGPPEWWEWWSMDARGIEDRLPAYESREPLLIEIFEKADKPPYYGSNHLLRFHTVYPDVWAKVEAEVGTDQVGPTCKKRFASTYYQWTKNGGFAVQYGAVDPPEGGGTADRAFHKQGAHALLKARFDKLEALNQYWIRFAEKHGYVETMPSRFIDPERGYPVMCTRTEWGGVLPTIPLNYHIQSTAMQWTNTAMIRTGDRLREWRREGFDAWLVMQGHDELVFAMPRDPDVLAHREAEKNGIPAPEGSNLWRARVLQRLMEQGGDDIGVPTPVSVEYHSHNWKEGVSM